MLRDWIRKRWLLALTLVLAVAGPLSAAVVFSLGGAIPVVAPPPFPGFTQPLTIGVGDTIRAIEVGRDDKSPYCAIVVSVGATNPAMTQLQTYVGSWPGGASVPGYPGGFTLRLVYRPVDDPAHPGWGGYPAAQGQIEDAWETVTALAKELDTHRTNFILGGPPVPFGSPFAPVLPWIYVEFDPTGPALFEFYKIQIVR